MSIQKYLLRDFTASATVCKQTDDISVVLEIFSQGQCDQIVVVSKRHCPVGRVNLRNLMSQLLAGGKFNKNLQQPLSSLCPRVIEPITTLPAKLSVEQFISYLRSRSFAMVTGCDWALVDQAGEFLGLLDTTRLWQFLALTPLSIAREESGIERRLLKSLTHLLEKLPWPLMLQKGSGEIVTQNTAWCQQFGNLSEAEVFRSEVEAVLASCAEKSIVISQPTSTGEASHELPLPRFQQYSQELVEPHLTGSKSSQSTLNTVTIPTETDQNFSSNRCQPGTHPGTCICTWSVQNGQERVWQFIKISLQESSLVFDHPAKPATPDSDLWLLIGNDVTEQQQLAAELAAKNADLIQLNRLKDEFLSCISHELKTPITAVMGLSNLLKDQALGQLNDRQTRYAQLIHQSGRHLMLVVNDILDLTRMETGQLQLTLEPVPIRTVCERAIEQAKAIHFKTSQPANTSQLQAESVLNHHFALLIEPSLNELVADELRLRQMLVHLLSNAFKFTEVGGEIGLQVSRWEGWIAFTVWDTGIGIPEQKQHLIFQKFQQLENPLTRKFEGTGLGLVLTRALARLHGGDVSFLSREGRGSQFTLLLPPSHPPDFKFAISNSALEAVSEQSQSFKHNKSNNLSSTSSDTVNEERCSSPEIPRADQYAQRQNQKLKLSNRLVLVVEAAPRFIENLTEQLNSLGYRVVIARSGTEALEKVRRLQPTAVFLNPLLPLLSGWDVLTLLKADAATRQIPIFVTATRAEKEQALSNRADEFLSLPVQLETLQQLLKRFFAAPANQSNKSSSTSTSVDSKLTILRLITSESTTRLSADTDLLVDGWEKPIPKTLSSILVNQRLLEADDLGQAELLARVWRPDVVLIDGVISDPINYLKQLSQYSSLAALPLVTLDAEITQAANQVAGLAVFPCLTATQNLDQDTLLPVLQIAAGMTWKPSVLVIDIATLTVPAESFTPDLSLKPLLKVDLEASGSSSHVSSGWFQALIQYLETAGFRGTVSHSWAEVLQQTRQQSADLLLIYLQKSDLHPSAIEALNALSQQPHIPPILVIAQQLRPQHIDTTHKASGSDVVATPTASAVQLKVAHTAQSKAINIDSVLSQIATKVLPHSLSMEELLDHIHQALAGLKI